MSYLLFHLNRTYTQDFGTSPPVTQYETHYVTAHKGPVTAAAFTADGQLCATGSVDTSIKVSYTLLNESIFLVQCGFGIDL